MRIARFNSRTVLVVSQLAVVAGLFAVSGTLNGVSGALGATRVVHQVNPTYKSCFTVMHEYGPTTAENPDADLDYVASAGVDGSSYIVQYRLRGIADGSWTSWSTPTENAAVGVSGETYAYEYDTGSHDGLAYGEVEWRIITNEHAGTNLRSNEMMVSVDDAKIVESTILASAGPCHGDDFSVNEIQWAWATVVYHH